MARTRSVCVDIDYKYTCKGCMKYCYMHLYEQLQILWRCDILIQFLTELIYVETNDGNYLQKWIVELYNHSCTILANPGI